MTDTTPKTPMQSEIEFVISENVLIELSEVVGAYIDTGIWPKDFAASPPHSEGKTFRVKDGNRLKWEAKSDLLNTIFILSSDSKYFERRALFVGGKSVTCVPDASEVAFIDLHTKTMVLVWPAARARETAFSHFIIDDVTWGYLVTREETIPQS